MFITLCKRVEEEEREGGREKMLQLFENTFSLEMGKGERRKLGIELKWTLLETLKTGV